MNFTKRLIKKFDIFGKQVSLKFDKRWDTHNTKIGGLATIILFLCVTM